MSPKEKAKKLVNVYLGNIPFADKSIERAKECALIAVDEILTELNDIDDGQTFIPYDYWNEVKHEINQL